MTPTTETALRVQEQQALIKTTIDKQLFSLSYQSLHLKTHPTESTVSQVLNNINQTRQLTHQLDEKQQIYALSVHAQLGAYVLHTATLGKKHGIFNNSQEASYVADGHQEADRALTQLQQIDIAFSRQGNYTIHTLATLQRLMPSIGPLSSEERTYFEFVFSMEQQRFQDFGRFLPGKEHAQLLINEIAVAFAFYTNEYEKMPPPPPFLSEVNSYQQEQARLRRHHPYASPQYVYPPQPPQYYPPAYPPQFGYQQPQPYHPFFGYEPPAFPAPGFPPSDAPTREELLGLPRFGPPRRNPPR